ncbi:MAG: hypothetical protein AAGG68_19270 [Bacteroidota bacterium]
MITERQLEGFNRIQKVHEYSTSTIQKYFLEYELQEGEACHLGNWIQSLSMIINDVTSMQFERDLLSSIEEFCTDEVLQLFQDAICQRNLKIVTNYRQKKSTWNIFKTYFRS